MIWPSICMHASTRSLTQLWLFQPQLPSSVMTRLWLSDPPCPGLQKKHPETVSQVIQPFPMDQGRPPSPYLTAHRAAGSLPGCSAEPSAARTASLPGRSCRDKSWLCHRSYQQNATSAYPDTNNGRPFSQSPSPGHGQQLPVLYFLTQLALSSFRNGGQFSHNDIIVREVAAGLGCHPVAGDRSVSLH